MKCCWKFCGYKITLQFTYNIIIKIERPTDWLSNIIRGMGIDIENEIKCKINI